MRGHEDTKQYEEGEKRRVQHEAAATSIKAPEARFTVYNKELERVEVFKYLGRLLAFDDNDSQAMWSNLMKARKDWSWVSHVLWVENTPPVFVTCSTKLRCSQSYHLGVKRGTLYLRR